MKYQDVFLRYSAGFLTGNEDFDRNIELKRAHTLRVVDYARKIAESVELAGNLYDSALYAALLHDYGRFEQLKQYNTFKDADSVNHGEFGAKLLTEQQFLADLPAEQATNIISAVRWHNAKILPSTLSGDALLLTQITRDADKLDIIQLVLSYHVNHLDNPTVTLGLSLERRLSAKVVAAIAAGGNPAYGDLETVYDFAMAKLSWYYDLNFPWSRAEYLRRGYADRIHEFVSGIQEAEQLFNDFQQKIKK